MVAARGRCEGALACRLALAPVTSAGVHTHAGTVGAVPRNHLKVPPLVASSPRTLQPGRALVSGAACDLAHPIIAHPHKLSERRSKPSKMPSALLHTLPYPSLSFFRFHTSSTQCPSPAFTPLVHCPASLSSSPQLNNDSKYSNQKATTHTAAALIEVCQSTPLDFFPYAWHNEQTMPSPSIRHAFPLFPQSHRTRHCRLSTELPPPPCAPSTSSLAQSLPGLPSTNPCRKQVRKVGPTPGRQPCAL